MDIDVSVMVRFMPTADWWVATGYTGCLISTCIIIKTVRERERERERESVGAERCSYSSVQG